MARLRGFLWLFTGLIVAVMAGLVAFTTLSNATEAKGTTSVLSGPDVTVVVAARAIDIRSALTAEDLELKSMPVETVPEGALRQIEDAVGLITLVDLYPGEVLLSQRLADPNVVSADGRTALVVVQDEVLFAFPAKDLMSKTGILKPGDQVDLLFTLEVPTGRVTALTGTGESAAPGAMKEEELATFNALQNVSVAAVVAGKTATGGTDSSAEAILLTVSPQDALVLKFALDSQAIPDIVLRAPGADQPFTTDPVDVDYMINRYQIPVEVGR